MLKMSWDNDVAEIAEHWAQQCTTDHDLYAGKAILATNPMGSIQKHFDVGQNIHWGESQANWSYIVEQWHSEIENFVYDEGKKDLDKEVEHYTQVVWAKSFKIGCSMVECEGNNWYAVCNYGPAGNVGNIYHPYTKGWIGCRCDTCEDGLCICDNLCWAGSMNVTSCSCLCSYSELAWVSADCSYDRDAAPAPNCSWSWVPDMCSYPDVAASCPKDCGICPAGK